MNNMKYSLMSLFLAAGVLVSMQPAAAATFRNGDAVSLPKTETVADDVYVFGGNVMSASEIQGDLVAAGGNVMVTGDVSQDLNAAGGTVDVLGDVGDDLRIAGGKVTVHGTVQGDLMIAGGMVQLLPGAVVKGSVHGAGALVVLDGDVQGGVNLSGGTVALNGQVGGPVDVRADDQVIFGKLAKFAQGVSYASPLLGDEGTGATFEQGVKWRKQELPIDQRSFWDRPDWGKAVGAGLAWFLIRASALLLAALLALKYFRREVEHVAAATQEKFTSRLVWGFCLLVVVPILVIALFVTVIGSVLGAALLAAYTLLAALARIAAGPYLGLALQRLFKARKGQPLDWKWVLAGVAAYEILWSIPLLGWAAGGLVFVAVFGTVALEAKARMK